MLDYGEDYKDNKYGGGELKDIIPFKIVDIYHNNTPIIFRSMITSITDSPKAE